MTITILIYLKVLQIKLWSFSGLVFGEMAGDATNCVPSMGIKSLGIRSKKFVLMCTDKKRWKNLYKASN